MDHPSPYGNCPACGSSNVCQHWQGDYNLCKGCGHMIHPRFWVFECQLKRERDEARGALKGVLDALNGVRVTARGTSLIGALEHAKHVLNNSE